MVTEEPQMNWNMQPIEDSSGNSFIGRVGSTQVFIKLDASPLLPSLSTEGLTPKILWIRKTPNGETLTAQSWIEGRTLTVDEMKDPQISKILDNLHNNRTLRDSLSTFDRSVARPAELLNNLIARSTPVSTNNYLQQVAGDMLKTIPSLNNLNIVVVHGDVSPSNWLKDEKTGQIYLIDWDTVSLGDAFYDTSYLLSHYIPYTEWGEWLARSAYDIKDILVLAKISWYGKLSFLQQINKHLLKGDTMSANNEILGLRRFSELF